MTAFPGNEPAQETIVGLSANSTNFSAELNREVSTTFGRISVLIPYVRFANSSAALLTLNMVSNRLSDGRETVASSLVAEDTRAELGAIWNVPIIAVCGGAAMMTRCASNGL